jgi:inosine-uridine nucleoside N-ribohydrolase
VEIFKKGTISGSWAWDSCITNYVCIIIINDNYDINITIIQRDSVTLGLWRQKYLKNTASSETKVVQNLSNA